MSDNPVTITHSVTILVPAVNEAVVIQDVVRETWAIANQLIGKFELILVDDGSEDDTGKIMDRLANELPYTRVIHNGRNLGFGASYSRGAAEAKMDYIMLVCGDGGLPTPNLPTIIANIGSADIVVPYMKNLKQIKTPFRYAISRLYTTYLNLLSGFRLKYYNGLAVYPRELVIRTPLKSTGFGFQGELLIKLLASGCSYIEIGVDGASKPRQRSVLLKPKNVLNIIGTCFMLLRELYTFKPLEVPVMPPERARRTTP
jgi:dolichol-phosphate mannosyltransferase